MPYKLSDNDLCVIKADSGEEVKCHKTHSEALAHLKALEANVKYTMQKTFTKFDMSEVGAWSVIDWCRACVNACAEMIDMAEDCGIDVDHSAAINACKDAIVACTICVNTCSGNVNAAEMVDDSKKASDACVLAMNACKELQSACVSCAGCCANCANVCAECAEECSRNAGIELDADNDNEIGEDNQIPANTMYSADFFSIDEYVSVKAGEPYRLLPFGTVVKGGKRHEITPAFAAMFKLPHFKPPIKLGSHEDTTPAGGSIVKLEVRQDGLYAFPEVTAKGNKALDEGDYRYHSPEILWEDSAIENPQTGEMVSGPFIVGDALLHTPHLGEATALYTFEPQKQKELKMQEMNVPKEQWDLFQAFKNLFSPKKEEPEKKPPEITPETYNALKTEADKLRSDFAALQMKLEHDKNVNVIKAELQAEKYGALFKADNFAAEAAAKLSELSEDQRKWFLQKFAAFSGQLDYASKVIQNEIGVIGASHESNPIDAFTAVISEEQKGGGIPYVNAMQAARTKHPELAEAYDAEMKRRAKGKE